MKDDESRIMIWLLYYSLDPSRGNAYEDHVGTDFSSYLSRYQRLGINPFDTITHSTFITYVRTHHDTIFTPLHLKYY
jgi:hypothetical protein